MGDVHGRKREKTTEELMKVRKEKEAVKIKEYNKLVQTCQQKISEQIYDKDTFSLTSQIVQWNPDFYTAWNYRRTVLMNSMLTGQEEEDQKIFNQELILFMQLIRINPKSYWLWNHRFWCLQTMPKPNWNGELDLVDKMLSMDARNFHGWDYRRYVINHLRKSKNKDDIYKLAESEYHFTTKKINQSFSNYSAWHQRSKLLPEIVAPMTVEEKNQVARNELELVKNAIYTDPEDQSAWLYYWWLLGKASNTVELMGAYRLKDTTFTVIAFNDIVRLKEIPNVVNKEGHSLNGGLYPLREKTGCSESASVWLYYSDQEAVQVTLSSESVLPSGSSKICLEKTWTIQVQQIEREKDVYERMKKSISENSKWKPSTSKIYRDPTTSDQTEWFTLDKTQLLKEEIDTVRELLEVEPESPWALQTLVHFLSQLVLRTNDVDKNKVYTEIISTLSLLMELDSDRKYRYKDQREWFLFEKATKETWDPANAPKVLNISSFSHIPLLSKLLLVPKIITCSKEMQNILSNLPFLEECTLNP